MSEMVEGLVSVDEWRRLEALKAATAISPDLLAATVIDYAKTFEAYLKGDEG